MVKIHKVLSVTDKFFLPPNGQRLINLIETLHGSLNSHEWPRENFLLTIPMQYQTEKWREEKKNTNQGITSWSQSKHYSTKYHYNNCMNCMADSQENYYKAIGSGRVKGRLRLTLLWRIYWALERGLWANLFFCNSKYLESFTRK